MVIAAASPLGPDPTTTASYSLLRGICPLATATPPRCGEPPDRLMQQGSDLRIAPDVADLGPPRLGIHTRRLGRDMRRDPKICGQRREHMGPYPDLDLRTDYAQASFVNRVTGASEAQYLGNSSAACFIGAETHHATLGMALRRDERE